jgi:hypothetical protein
MTQNNNKKNRKHKDLRIQRSERNAHTHARGITEFQNSGSQSAKKGIADHQQIGGLQSVQENYSN